jgi:hypothetical protein
MWYRIGATRNMTGGRKIQPTLKMSDKLKEVRMGVCKGGNRIKTNFELVLYSQLEIEIV